jgi:serine palmitoyltransferase
MEAGNHDIVQELESAVASFVGKEAAIVFGMGYATNSTSIPAFASEKGTLIISDGLNHNSIVCGSRGSNCGIRVFKHNNVEHLEKVLQEAVKSKRWSKIIIIVEGIYSMEGQVCKLPDIVALKKKYKAYLYVDEAHSIGALGKSGRGVCEYWGVNPADVDILMGTFTKAFGSVGGYISGSKEFIDYLRSTSYGSVYATSMSPPCAQQALQALKVIITPKGQERVSKLHDNSNFFRARLKELGYRVFGDKDSPVVPMMVYHPCKIAACSRELLKKGVAIVIVGAPVTPILLARIRFCISAGHTKEDLEYAIKNIDEVGSLLLVKQ